MDPAIIVALISGPLLFLLGATGWVFRNLLKNKDDQLMRAGDEIKWYREKLLPILERQQDALDGLEATLRELGRDKHADLR